MNFKIGCQGWNYPDWTTKAGGENIFYPRGTKSNEMLEVYSRAFETVEVDSTFYAIPQETTLENWHKKTPENFSFSLKLPQEITHAHGLRESCFPILEEFCERVVLLHEKLAAILIQLPPQFDASEENIRALLEFLPQLPRKMRFAIEFRSRDWLKGETTAVLAKFNVSLCLTEGSWIPRGLMFESAKAKTADFTYVRFMGERDLTRFDKIQRNENANLRIWHEFLQEIAANTSRGWIYFSNFY